MTESWRVVSARSHDVARPLLWVDSAVSLLNARDALVNLAAHAVRSLAHPVGMLDISVHCVARLSQRCVWQTRRDAHFSIDGRTVSRTALDGGVESVVSRDTCSLERLVQSSRDLLHRLANPVCAHCHAEVAHTAIFNESKASLRLVESPDHVLCYFVSLLTHHDLFRRPRELGCLQSGRLVCQGDARDARRHAEVVHLDALAFRVVQELLEHVDAFSVQVRVQCFSKLVQSLTSLPFVLTCQHLVVLSVEAEELLLVMVCHLTDVYVWPFANFTEPQQAFMVLD